MVLLLVRAETIENSTPISYTNTITKLRMPHDTLSYPYPPPHGHITPPPLLTYW